MTATEFVKEVLDDAGIFNLFSQSKKTKYKTNGFVIPCFRKGNLKAGILIETDPDDMKDSLQITGVVPLSMMTKSLDDVWKATKHYKVKVCRKEDLCISKTIYYFYSDTEAFLDALYDVIELVRTFVK